MWNSWPGRGTDIKKGRCMVMGRKFLLLSLCILMAAFLPGCGESLENHSALSLQEDGVWEQRYQSYEDMDSGTMKVKVSINVKKDMDEKKMLKVLDYYCLNLTEGSGLDIDKEKVAVYGVFYKGDTDEEIARFKYVNGKSVSFTEEEQYSFLTPDKKNIDEDE